MGVLSFDFSMRAWEEEMGTEVVSTTPRQKEKHMKSGDSRELAFWRLLLGLKDIVVTDKLEILRGLNIDSTGLTAKELELCLVGNRDWLKGHKGSDMGLPKTTRIEDWNVHNKSEA